MMSSNRPSRRCPRAWPTMIVGSIAAALLWPTLLAADETAHKRGECADSEPAGFVFLNGHYVVAPYIVEQNGTKLRINGQQIDAVSFDLSAYAEDEQYFDVHFVSTRKRRPKAVAIRQLASDILFAVDSRDVVVIAEHRPPLILDGAYEGAEFLETILNFDQRDVRRASIIDSQGWVNSKSSWLEQAFRVDPTPEFVAHATDHLTRLRVIDDKNDTVIAASVWTDRLGYPLTVFAMVLVVVSFGHLMSNKPCIGAADDRRSGNDLSARQVVMRSLLLVALLSMVDLVWTILASHTGVMRELNPLGRQWIDSPLQLVLFKFTVVSAAVGLLYWLHQRPIAQVASWWSCLVLALVTARWLTFNSMFL